MCWASWGPSPGVLRALNSRRAAVTRQDGALALEPPPVWPGSPPTHTPRLPVAPCQRPHESPGTRPGWGPRSPHGERGPSAMTTDVGDPPAPFLRVQLEPQSELWPLTQRPLSSKRAGAHGSQRHPCEAPGHGYQRIWNPQPGPRSCRQEASSLCSGREGRWDLDARPDPASGLPGNPGSWLLALCPGLHNSRPPARRQRDLPDHQRSRGQGPTRTGENAQGSQMANRHQLVDRCPGHLVTHG